MKIDKTTFNYNNILLFVGILIVVISYFLPLTTSCKQTNGPEEFISTTQYGYETFTYLLSSVFILLIILASYLGNDSYILTIVLVLLGGSITLFFNWIGQAGWGAPCGHKPTQFQTLLYFSHILIIVMCFDKIASSRKNRKANDNVLD
jgi:hypothetical protein